MKFPKLDKNQKNMVLASALWSLAIISMVFSLFRVHYLDSSQAVFFWMGTVIGIAACMIYISDRYEGTLLFKVTVNLGFYFIWSCGICALLGLIMAMDGLDCSKDYHEYRYSTSKKTWSVK